MLTLQKTFGLRVDPFYYIIIAIAVSFLFLNMGIYYGNMGIDSWYYFGYYNDYSNYLKLFPYPWTYYHGRLGHILPGYISSLLFPIGISGAVYHFVFLVSFIIALYILIRDNLSRRTAIFTSLAAIFYPHIIYVFSDDYPCFSALTYCVISLCFIAKAYFSERRPIYLFLAGVFGALMLNSQIFTIPYCIGLYFGFFLVYYVKNKFKNIINDLILYASGALLIIFLMASFNYLMGGDFLFFLRTIQFNPISNIATERHGWKSYFISRYLWSFTFLYFVFTAYAIVLLIRKRKELSDFKLSIYLGIILNALIIFAFSFVSLMTLAMDFNTALLMPQFFIVFACIIAAVMDKISSKIFIFFMVAIIVFALLGGLLIPDTFKNIYYDSFNIFPAKEYISKLLVYDLIILCLLLPFLISRKVFFIFMIPLVIFFMNMGKIWYFPSLSHKNYTDAVLMFNKLKDFDPSGYTFFWYNMKNIPAVYLPSIYLFNYRTAGCKFPQIGYFSLGGSSENTVFCNQKICLITASNEMSADKVLSAARENLKAYGFGFDLLDTTSCNMTGKYDNGKSFDMSVQNLNFIRVKNLYKESDFNNKTDLFKFENNGFSEKFSTCGYSQYKSKIPVLGNLFPLITKPKNANVYRYSPYFLADHITSDFFNIPSGPDDVFLLLDIEYDSKNLPSEVLDIKIQDWNYNPLCEILGKYMFDPEKNSYCQILKLPKNTEKIRLNIFSRNASSTFLPTSIKLSTGNIKNK